MSDEAHLPPVFVRAAEFVSEMWSEHGPSSEMHIGDLAWGTFQHWPSAFPALRLWPDGEGQTQALTMFDGSGVCDLVVRPGRAGLDAAMKGLEWAERARAARATGSEPIEHRVGRRLQSAEVVELLHARGFERRAVGVPAMSRTIAGADIGSPSVPTGYVIRELHTDDLPSRVLAFNAAFPGEELCVDAYRALRACPPYNPRLDVVATSPSSQVAASQHSGWTYTTASSRSNRLAVTPATGASASHKRSSCKPSDDPLSLAQRAQSCGTSAPTWLLTRSTRRAGSRRPGEDTGFTKTILPADLG